MSSQGIMSSKEANNNPGLGPVKGLLGKKTYFPLRGISLAR